MGKKRLGWTDARAFLGALARDARANTLAIMAIALIPLAGMVGGGVDISRMYIVKTRLQHACDAGALAGRKTMGGGTWTQTVGGVANYPQVQAGKFFDANYNKNAYGIDPATVTKTFTENAGKVSGTASATVPMTLMRIFGKTSETLTVTCDAEMRLPNTDVMFVLDTTGSMGDPQPGDTVNKITALKTAVKCFFEIVARLDTDATCTTGTPGGGVGNQVQIRFGFVPYATNVNVGRLLKPEWFASTAKYQTRKQSGTAWTNWTTAYFTSKSQGSCVAPANTSTQQYTSTATGWGGSWACRVDERHQGPNWIYDQLDVNVGLLKNGTDWNSSYNFQWPINDDGSNRTVSWQGCIEERDTVSTTDYDPIPSGAKDLNIDLVPSQSDATTLWKPALPDVIFTRKDSSGNWTRSQVTTPNNFDNESSYFCPTAAKKLQVWSSASDFDDYVDQLTPDGNTYHDVGLIWGARLLSPTGIFASENAHTPQGGDIERHMIFMTDGDACTGVSNYTSHGVDWYDRRTLPANTNPTDGCTSTGNLTEQVNLRTEGLCAAIKNKNITLWVIAFGNLASSTETRLQNCATTGRYFKATNAAELQNTFKSIADQISQLRLTK